MSRRPRSFIASAALVLLVAGLARCTTSTQDNFTSPPVGPPATCVTVAPLARCVAGSLSYSCTSDRPDDGDTSLVCDQGTPALDGTTSYCCAPYGQWATECVPESHVPGCGAQSLGFSCAGASTPAEVDPSLACSQAIAGDGGASQFCCISADEVPGLCRCDSFDEDAGLCGLGSTSCSGAAIGFTCVSGHAPSELNPSLACDGADGGESFCCKTP